jgi:hypothetical protein
MKPMIYEERRYDVSPARKAEFIKLFKDMGIPLISKYGGKIIGVWDTIIGNRNEVVVLLAFDDVLKRMECWDKFKKDEKFVKAIPTLPSNGVTCAILQPLDYSPLQ